MGATDAVGQADVDGSGVAVTCGEVGGVLYRPKVGGRLRIEDSAGREVDLFPPGRGRGAAISLIRHHPGDLGDLAREAGGRRGDSCHGEIGQRQNVVVAVAAAYHPLCATFGKGIVVTVSP
ncbi:MAG: hypothetical protein R2873_22355 [Caldilineaceae bacterium]